MVKIRSVRGSSVDLERLWSLPITTVIDGKNVEAFCLDATGLLVYRSGDTGAPQSLIPHAVDAWELDKTLMNLLEVDIRKKLTSPLAPRQFTGLYKDSFPRFPHLYAAPGEFYAEKALLKSAIEAYQNSDKDTRVEIEDQLAEVGLYPFFSTTNLGPEYFESSSRTLTKRKLVEAGWVNRDSIFQKAKYL